LRLEVRLLDRFFDNYVHASLQKIVADRLRAAERRDPQGVAEAHAMLDTCYGWLDKRMADRAWAMGAGFTLADCAAAPALFYADWVHPIGDAHPNVAAYRARLLARPSVKRAVDDARPFRPIFPGGAPDRD
jgi:glutathione S-transferase